MTSLAHPSLPQLIEHIPKAFIKAWQADDRAKLEQLLVPGYVSARDKIEAVSLQSAQITESLVEGNEETADSLLVVLRGNFSYTDSGGEENASQCDLELSKVNDGWRVGYVDCY